MKLEHSKAGLKTVPIESKAGSSLILDRSPNVEEGVNMVKTDQLRDLHRVLAREMDLNSGEAVWLDAHNICSTYNLSKQSSTNILDRIKISRSFTPYQHYKSVNNLDEHINDNVKWLVVSGPAELYSEGQINEWDAKELFNNAWDLILQLQEKHRLKVIVDCPKNVNSLTSRIKRDSDNIIEFERNKDYTRCISDDSGTLIYCKKGFMQTTIPFWERKSLVS